MPSGDFSGLPLDLLPPGARALGLGGAFTGVADDATAALNALYHWLQRRSRHERVSTLTEFVGEHGDGALASEIERLQQALLSASAWSGAGLEAALRESRTARTKRAAERRSALPPLNPRHGP